MIEYFTKRKTCCIILHSLSFHPESQKKIRECDEDSICPLRSLASFSTEKLSTSGKKNYHEKNVMQIFKRK